MTGLDSLSYSVPFSGKLALDKHASKACFYSCYCCYFCCCSFYNYYSTKSFEGDRDLAAVQSCFKEFYLVHSNINQNFDELSLNVFFTSDHLHETWNPWMTIFPIYWDFEWKTCQLQGNITWNWWNYMNLAWNRFHNI